MGVDSADEVAATLDGDDLSEVLGTEDFVFVDDFNAAIGEVLEGTDELRYEYVIGDVSDAGESAAGHLHFDLVSEGSTVHCIRFGGRPDSGDSEIGEGAMVAVKGDLSYYRAEGQVSLIVEHIVNVGEGAYSQILEAARRQLEQEGLLAEEAKQTLPEFPKRVGLITSAGSDAREDAVTSIQGRHPDVDILITDVTVQGEDAMASMMRAIGRLDDDGRVDVIVLTRGGGAEKHLRVFNETPLCRVIHYSETPVVVGVGHENDRTLADEVADHRVMTPTEVGEIVPRRDALEEDVDALAERLADAYVRTTTDRLESWASEFQVAYRRRATTRLTDLAGQLEHAYETVAGQGLTSYETRLDHAMETARQQHEFEAERARTRRRQRALVAVLVLVVLALLGYIILTGL